MEQNLHGRVIALDKTGATETCAAGIRSSARENPAAEHSPYPAKAAHSCSQTAADANPATAVRWSQVHRPVRCRSHALTPSPTSPIMGETPHSVQQPA